MEVISIENVRRVKWTSVNDLKPRDIFRLKIDGWDYVLTEHKSNNCRVFVTIKGGKPIDIGSSSTIGGDFINRAIRIIDGEPEYEDVPPDGVEKVAFGELEKLDIYRFVGEKELWLKGKHGARISLGNGLVCNGEPPLASIRVIRFTNAALVLDYKGGE